MDVQSDAIRMIDYTRSSGGSTPLGARLSGDGGADPSISEIAEVFRRVLAGNREVAQALERFIGKGATADRIVLAADVLIMELRGWLEEIAACRDVSVTASGGTGVTGAEWRLLSHELHDRVSHDIASALRFIELAEVYGERNAEAAGCQIERAKNVLSGAVDNVRRISSGMRPRCATENLADGLRAYADSHGRPGVVTAVRVLGDESRIPGPARNELFLVLREAMHNALTHARARRVTVSVGVLENCVRARVQDDGIGLDADPHSRASGGMAAMRDRVSLLGGTMAISCRPRQRTGIRVWIPLR